MMKIAGKILYGIFIALLVGIAGLFLASLLPIPGNIEVKIVKSGSMEPTIMTGAITVVRPADSYAVGDIVMFGEDTRESVPTTHRIVAAAVEDGQTVFTTKGDANEEEDPQPVYESDVIGKVMFSAPYVGFVLDFARTPVGFALLVGVPALMIIVDEIGKIAAEIKKMRLRKREDGDDEDEDEGEEEGGGEPEEEERSAAPRREARQESLAQRTLPRSLMSVDGIIPASALSDYYGIRLIPAKRARGSVYFRAKTLAIVFALIGSSSGIFAIGGTSSKYADKEMSIGNRFGTLGIDLVLSAGEEPAARMMSFAAAEDGESRAPTVDIGTTHFDIAIGEEGGSHPLVYSIEAVLGENGPAACEELALEASFGGESWSGLFKDFSRPATDEMGTWSFSVSVPEEGALCEGSLVFRAFPKGEDGALSRIYSDREEYHFILQNHPAPKVLGADAADEIVPESLEPKGSNGGDGEEEPKEEPIVPEAPKEEVGAIEPPVPEPVLEDEDVQEVADDEEEPAAEEKKEDPVADEEPAVEDPAPEPEKPAELAPEVPTE